MFIAHDFFSLNNILKEARFPILHLHSNLSTLYMLTLYSLPVSELIYLSFLQITYFTTSLPVYSILLKILLFLGCISSGFSKWTSSTKQIYIIIFLSLINILCNGRCYHLMFNVFRVAYKPFGGYFT